MRRTPTLATIVVACLLVTAGCSTGSQLAGSGGDGGTPAAGDTGTNGDGAGGTEAESAGTPAVPAGRKLVHTAELTVRVDSFSATESNLTAAVRDHGGYVGDATMRTEEYGDETYTEGTLVLRVPVKNYRAFLSTVRGEGVVLTSHENVDDVTRQYVDLQARLENLRRQRDRLRDLYERANDTEEVLAVEERLSEVQGEIERTEARLRTLRNQVTYATVTVHVREERPERPLPEQTHWYDTGVVAAFLESVDGVVVVLRALVVGSAYVAPYLLAFGLPVLGAAALLRRLRGGLPSIPGRGRD